MKLIPLGGKYGKGKFALVDDEDFERLNQFRWFVRKQYEDDTSLSVARGYIAGYRDPSKPKSHKNSIIKITWMHREIMNPPEGMVVSFINNNGLDNRKENLRVCTEKQANWGNRPRKRKRSKYKGVVYSKGPRSKSWWLARAVINGKAIYFGHHRTEEAAAKAYDEGVKKLRGDFAYLNFP